MDKNITVFSTKHWATTGIQEIQGELSGGMIRHRKLHGNTFFISYLHGEGREWHRSREDAVKRADELRKRKVASLRKQITKLEDMSF